MRMYTIFTLAFAAMVSAESYCCMPYCTRCIDVQCSNGIGWCEIAYPWDYFNTCCAFEKEMEFVSVTGSTTATAATAEA
ncbi:hypothetical protein B0T17DRAFT_619937 [Bombardia bombarda]|uniref:Uncharacterized protein n=1 Tax=Bombardia bombarda TaxID=252184 RepID=A0AA39WGU2_9PEZI|nr:hypothetical protein B0T17DRAFT_619937 [Bombardia bombarda]